MLNISVLANGCAYCIISQTFPEAVKRLDLSFQGKFLYSPTMIKKRTAFYRKYVLWRVHFENEYLTVFSS